MIEDNKLISNIYTVQQFQFIFRIYVKILILFLLVTFFLGLISRNPQIFESGILEPYRSSLLIAITISAIVVSPYFLYILLIERKKKWILSFFMFVVLPFFLAYMIFKQFFFSMMGAFFPILFYGIYCILLKSEVDKWLNKYYWHQRKEEIKKEKDALNDIDNMGQF